MDITYTRKYKNAELSIVVEDDELTMCKAIVDDELIECAELGEGEHGLPNKRVYVEKVYDYLKEKVDENFAKEFAVVGVN